MKAPFPRFRIRELSHLQMQNAVSRIVKEVKPSITSDITMPVQLSLLERTAVKHEQLLKRVSGSDITSQINIAKADRDRSCKLFFSKVKTHCDDFEQPIADAAKAVYVIIEKHGGTKLIRRSFAEQSTGIGLIIGELSKPEMKARLEILGVLKDFDRMKQMNQVFEELWKLRITETAEAEELPAMTDTRRKMETTLRTLLDNIEILYLENHPMISDTLYNSIREMIIELDSNVGLRETIAQKAKSAEESSTSAS